MSQAVSAQAKATPEAIALAGNGKVLTYAELDARSSELAHRLHSLGVGPNVVAGVCLNRSPEFVIGALGVLKAGGAYLPLDPAFPVDRLAFMVADSQALVVVTQEDLAAQLSGGKWQAVMLDDGNQRLAARSGN